MKQTVGIMRVKKSQKAIGMEIKYEKCGIDLYETDGTALYIWVVLASFVQVLGWGCGWLVKAMVEFGSRWSSSASSAELSCRRPSSTAGSSDVTGRSSLCDFVFLVNYAMPNRE